MKAFVACIALALVACASAEAPSGYNYNRPSGGGGGGGYSGGSGGGYSGGGGGGGGLIGGGPYRSVPAGYTTSEGQNVDPQLLEQIRNILLKEEAQSGSGGGHSGGGGAPSSSYGAPSASYGPPSTSYGVPSARVVGIVLDGVRQAIQVAQYEQSGGSSGGGYPASGVPSGSYGAPY